jgi:uridine kinase
MSRFVDNKSNLLHATLPDRCCWTVVLRESEISRRLRARSRTQTRRRHRAADLRFRPAYASAATEIIETAPFILVEELFALYWPELRDLLNLRIYIHADRDTCLARRIFRDVRERGRTEDSVRQQYEAMVRPMCERYVASTRVFTNLTLSGVANVKQSVYTILIYIAGHLGDPSVSELAPED